MTNDQKVLIGTLRAKAKKSGLSDTDYRIIDDANGILKPEEIIIALKTFLASKGVIV